MTLVLDKTNIRESRESSPFREAAATGQRREIVIIEAGWGSSGYYSEAVLERDIPRIFPVGTHMYLDHPTFSEEQERPERSVKELVGVLTETPRMAGIAAVASCEIFEHWVPVIDALSEHIGLSIRAFGVAEEGDAAGKRGPLIQTLTEGLSIDYVTQAGAGGSVGPIIESVRERIVPLIESAREHSPTREALASDVRESLSNAGQEAWGSEDVYVYCEDFDEANGYAVFWINPDDSAGYYYKQAFSADEDGGVSFSGDPETVERQTEYVPASEAIPPPCRVVEEARNAGHWLEAFIHRTFTERTDNLFGEGHMTREERIICSEAIGQGLQAFSAHLEENAPQLFQRDPYAEFGEPEAAYLSEKASGGPRRLKEGDSMTEEERKRLSEAEDRVRELERENEELTQERDSANTRADRAEDSLRLREAAEIAYKAVNAVEALRSLPKAQARVVEASCRDLPTDSDGRIDKDALKERATNKAKEELEYLGITQENGSVTGLGESSQPGSGGSSSNGGGEEENADVLSEALQGLGMPESASKIAAEGR